MFFVFNDIFFYKLAEKISWEGSFYRKDIGYRAIAREQQ